MQLHLPLSLTPLPSLEESSAPPLVHNFSGYISTKVAVALCKRSSAAIQPKVDCCGYLQDQVRGQSKEWPKHPGVVIVTAGVI